MRYTQPQGGPLTIDRSRDGARLILAAIPGLSRSNLSSGVAATISGTAPSGNFVGVAPEGIDLMIHPAGGTNGFGGLRFGAETVGSSNDFTLIWVGRPQNFSTINGPLVVRGADGFGNGWNLKLAYEGGPNGGPGTANLSAYAIDSSPASFNATISGLSLLTDRHERVALVKRGNTISIYNWRTRQTASASAGNGALRTSTLGIGLGLDGSGAPAGHNKPNTVLAFDKGLDSAAVWALLDNPWQEFKSPQRVMNLAVAPASITGSLAATLAAPSMSSTGLVALPGTLAATLAAPTFAASGIAATPPQGTFAATLAAPVMSASGIATNYAQLAATMAAPTMSATGTAAPHATGTLTFTMPAPTMSAFGFLGATAPAAPVRPYRWRILRRHFVVN